MTVKYINVGDLTPTEFQAYYKWLSSKSAKMPINLNQKKETYKQLGITANLYA